MTCEPIALTLPHHIALLALLKAITLPAGAHLGGYDGEVPDHPTLDADGRVRPYWVLYGGNGDTSIDRRLAGYGSALLYDFGVTAVGGDNNRCLWAVDRINEALVGQRLVVGDRSGIVHPRLATDVVPNKALVPPRYVVAARFHVLTA